MTSNFLCFEALHIVGARFHLNKALYINLLLYIFLMHLYVLRSGLCTLKWLELINEKAESINEYFSDFFSGGAS